MQQTSSFQVRTNTARRKHVKEILAKKGIPLPVAIEMFFAKVEEVRGIPFDMKERSEVPNAYFRKHLKASDEDVKKGRVARFDSMKEAIAQLRKEVL